MSHATRAALFRNAYFHFFDYALCEPRNWQRLSLWGPILTERLYRVAASGEDLTSESAAMIREGLSDEEAPEFVARVIFAAHQYTFRPLPLEERAMIERMKVIARQFVPVHVRKLMCGRPLNIPSLQEIEDSVAGRLTLDEMRERLAAAFEC
ncbi:hypothetical protein ACRC7T_17455 (plasmid) [Segnochrobactraceae bacterium EtOH-i3]